MTLDKMPWSVAGTIVVASVLGWIWLADQTVDPDELEARVQPLSAEHQDIRDDLAEMHRKHSQQMVSMLLDQALGAVRYWESRPGFPDLSTNDRLMYEEKLQKVIAYRGQLVEMGL